MPRHSTVSKAPGSFTYSCAGYGSGAAVGVARSFYGSSLYASAAQKIGRAFQETELDDNETRPPEAVISGITAVVEEVSKTTALPAEAEVSVFYGEALVTWRCAGREISLLSRGNPDDPKILRYEANQGQASSHQIYRNATPSNLKDALGWLYA